jgi:oligopeptide/dipeptide ABC transporter ATP-binding protein
LSIWKGLSLNAAQQSSIDTSSTPLLEVRNLFVHYPVKTPFLERLFSHEKLVVHAVDGVSFALQRGEVFGLVGESGCGKTTVGRTILRLVEPTSGLIKFEGKDITRMKEGNLRPLRRRMQIIFQDPHASLNPAMTLGQGIGHPLKIQGLAWYEGDIRKIVLEAMRDVGLTPEEQLYDKYPADLSGGQKQRAVIARAIILKPELVVADEPVAMLDMSIRAKVLELMLELKRKYNLTYLFITHDLATAKFLCDRIAIMYLGRIVEMGSARDIYKDPKHPYTQALLRAIPIPDPQKRAPKVLPKGEVPDAVHPPAGCRFHPRCPAVLNTCGWEGRDFVDYLEERRLDPKREMQDELVLGPLNKWWAKGFAAGKKIGAEDPAVVISYIKEILKDASQQLASAVNEISIREGSIVVSLKQPDQLAPKKVEGRLVECLLY